MANQRDLSRAYSPGVAEACLEIKADPQAAARYTAQGNLVAVVSNGIGGARPRQHRRAGLASR